MSRRTWLALAGATAALATPAAAAAAPYRHVPRATAEGTGGAAASVDSVASKAATSVLKRGGNAVDAAVAAAAVLGVTEPFSSGVGGGGFMLIRTPDGKVTTIDSREKAPLAMTRTSFFENGAALPFSDARYSGLSVGVPGTVAAWDTALRKYGTWSFKQVLAPAIDVAKRGFVVDPTFVSQIAPNVPWFDDIATTRALYLKPDGTPLDAGSVVKNPGLARTYRRIAKLGAKQGFYTGPIAEALVKAARTPPTVATADKTWRPGLITTADVARYRIKERRPTRVEYEGYDVWGMGPPSSGGSTVAEALQILEPYDLGAMDRAQAMHLFLEASRLAYADRGAYLADPSFFPVPLQGLLSSPYAAQRRALIDPLHAQPGSVRPGVPPGAAASTMAADDAQPGQSTTHLTVADANGTVVSYTFTIESTGGSGILVPKWGFLLNNELTDFDYTTPMAPNAPAGGKRPRSSIAPTLVTRDGRPVFATGSPGGASIITTVLQILLGRLDLGQTLEQAIAAPRASQRNGATTQAEPAFIASPEGQALAAQYGQVFAPPAASDNYEIGAATGIEFLSRKRFLAAAEPARRGRGAAEVVKRGR